MQNNSELTEKIANSNVATQEVIATIRENQSNQVKDLKWKKNRLIDKGTEMEIQLSEMAGRMWNFFGVYRKGFWAKVLPIIVFILVATAEMPLNATAFEILGRSQNETLLIALLFGAAIALMAELSGLFLKRYVVTKKTSNFVVGILVLAITTTGLWVSAELRDQYISTMNSETTLKTSQMIWFLMSFFIFSAGVVSSYHFTTSVKNRNEEKSYFRLLRQFDKNESQIVRTEKAIDDVNKKSSQKIEDLVKSMIDKEKEQEKESVAPPTVVDNTELEEAKKKIINRRNQGKVSEEDDQYPETNIESETKKEN